MTAPDRVDTEIQARCTRCGHSSTLFVSDKSVREELVRNFNIKAARILMKIFWRGWLVSFALGMAASMIGLWAAVRYL